MPGFGVKQMDSMMYFAQMVAVGKMLPPDEAAALDQWDSTMVGKGGLGTSDWPGWRKYIGEPPWYADDWARPKPKPKAPISAALRKAVFERDGYRCRECDGWIELECDHVIPESLGGLTELGNLQALCGPCNRKKGARLS